MDDSANHSTPTIRHYVRLEMKRREIEMEVTKQDESNVEEKKEVVVTSIPSSDMNQEIGVNTSVLSPINVEVKDKEENSNL